MPDTIALFAGELRRRSAAFGSIARVCQATGINRQQFNKYLSGKVLPNARNMQKICSVLGVNVGQLMAGEPSVAQPIGSEIVIHLPSARAAAAQPVPLPQADLAETQPPQLTLLSERPANVLPVGYYDCYFPLHASSEMVVRWLISLRMKRGVLTFTCRSNIRTMGSPGSFAALSKYHGFVQANGRDAHLIATSDVHLHQPGVITVGTLPVVGRSYFSGIALTRRIDGPLAITAALRYRGHTLRVRQALDAIGIISLRDPDLDPVIAQLMRATPAAGANWMQAVNGKSLRTVSPSGGFGLTETTSRRQAAG